MACFFVVLEILIMNVNLPGNFVRKKVQKVQPGIRIIFGKRYEKFNQVSRFRSEIIVFRGMK